MGNLDTIHDDSKDIYLRGILERLRLLKLEPPLIDKLSCYKEYDTLLKVVKPGVLTMDDMITLIDKIYTDSKYLAISIMLAGVGKKELNAYL